MNPAQNEDETGVLNMETCPLMSDEDGEGRGFTKPTFADVPKVMFSMVAIKMNVCRGNANAFQL